jgi:hypothetical protein
MAGISSVTSAFKPAATHFDEGAAVKKKPHGFRLPEPEKKHPHLQHQPLGHNKFNGLHPRGPHPVFERPAPRASEENPFADDEFIKQFEKKASLFSGGVVGAIAAVIKNL